MFFLLSIFVVSKLKLYHGRDFSGVATIERDKVLKDAVFKFNLPLKFTLYAGDHVNSIHYLNPIYEGIGPGNFTLNNIPPLRKYFQLVTREGKSLLADKHLPIAKGFNFRDLGGIPTKDGRHIKWGKILRSDEFFNLTTEDLNYLKSISLKTVVDFRSEAEKNSKPDLREFDNYVELPVEGGNVEPLITQAIISGKTDPAPWRKYMIDLYVEFVTNSTYVELYKKLFANLQDSTKIPLDFHCSAGKDRTGTAAFLILSSLGVSQEVILKDYLLSNEYLQDKYGGYVRAYPLIEPLVSVTEEYFQTLVTTIQTTYGSVENYLTGPLNVNLDRVKELFLD